MAPESDTTVTNLTEVSEPPPTTMSPWGDCAGAYELPRMTIVATRARPLPLFQLSLYAPCSVMRRAPRFAARSDAPPSEPSPEPRAPDPCSSATPTQPAGTPR